MGTRASIRFSDGEDEYFVYRGHDGYPENVDKDIKNFLKEIKGRWSEPDLGCLVTCFIGWYYDKRQRLPDYELTTCVHGDESYRYYVDWNPLAKDWLTHFE
jgi:hypothetical protein